MYELDTKEIEYNGVDLVVPDNECVDVFLDNIKPHTVFQRDKADNLYIRTAWLTMQYALSKVVYKMKALREHNEKLNNKLKNKKQYNDDLQIISVEEAEKKIKGTTHKMYKTVIFRELTSNNNLDDYKLTLKEVSRILFCKNYEHDNHIIHRYKKIQEEYEKSLTDFNYGEFFKNGFTFDELYILYDQKVKINANGVYLTITTNAISREVILGFCSPL